MKDYALIIVALLFGLGGTLGLARAFLVVVTVRRESMQPTLQDGDRVLVIRHWPRRWLHRGQIVVVWPRSFPAQGSQSVGRLEPCVKRIFGLPGDTFAVYADQEDQYFLENERPCDSLDWRWVRHIPDQHFFVYGDNPLDSFDSRTWGPLPFGSVVGLVVLKLVRRRIPPAPRLSISASVDSAAR